jgi:hypothetical protein
MYEMLLLIPIHASPICRLSLLGAIAGYPKKTKKMKGSIKNYFLQHISILETKIAFTVLHFD